MEGRSIRVYLSKVYWSWLSLYFLIYIRVNIERPTSVTLSPSSLFFWLLFHTKEVSMMFCPVGAQNYGVRWYDVHQVYID